jgi:hypothetical protein
LQALVPIVVLAREKIKQNANFLKQNQNFHFSPAQSFDTICAAAMLRV